MLRIPCAIIIATFAFAQNLANAQPAIQEPGGRAVDADLAINNPDEYAWQLFLFINRQAVGGVAGVADPTKSIQQYDADVPVVWETWALASGTGSSQTGSEVYKPGGEKPVDWSLLPRGTSAPLKVFSVNTKTLLARRELFTPRDNNLLVFPLAPLDQEVRMNQAAYKFVGDNELYYAGGLEAKLSAARSTNNPNLIQFSKEAKEIKAQWEKMDMSKEQEEKARYHWRSVGGEIYKLTAFHVITKDLPAWFWSDFVHVDYEQSNGVKIPSRDSTTRSSPGNPNPPSKGTVEGERKELTNTKWANYRLRGTQVSFVDARGNPVILGNPEIETAFPDQSSCMACHARATIGPLAATKRASTLSGGEDGNVQPPNPNLFVKDGAIQFLQNDFVWSAPSRAQAKL